MSAEQPTNEDLHGEAAEAVVVGVDGSPHAEDALAWAAEQAALEHRPLMLLYAPDSAAAYSRVSRGEGAVDHRQMQRNLEAEARRLVDDAAERARGLQPELDVRPHVTWSDARHALLEVAEHAALVVVGTRGRGPIGSLLLGSVSSAVSRHATCPVVVPRSGALQHPGGVLVGVDGRPSSRPALDFAFRQASLRGRPLTALHTHVDQIAMAYGLHIVADSAEVDEAFRTLAEAVAGFAEEYPDVEVTQTVRGDRVGDALLSAGSDASLIVLGRHHSGPLAALHGGFTTTVLEHTDTTVAVVPTT